MSTPTVVVTAYDPNWPRLYEEMAAPLRTAFGRLLISIHHIGSTSVPGLAAKPIIDVMPLVHDIQAVETVTPALTVLDYIPRGENGIPGRRFFKRERGVIPVHVHTYAPGNLEISRHLDFRDYLIAHPQVAAEYARVKAEMARRFPHDIDGYVAGKAPFVQETIQSTHEWRRLSAEM